MNVEELLVRAQGIALRSSALARSRYAGLYRSAFRGMGVEFAEVRPYAEGDDVRLIDWNVSARNRGLYVKQMVEERERQILIALDRSASLSFGSVRRTKHELLLEAGALLVLSAYYAKDRVSLAVFNDTVERFIPPAKGWTHALRLVREMAIPGPGTGPQDELDPVWALVNSPGVPRSLVFLLTDFAAPIVPGDALSTACRKHEVVAVLASDPREWQLPRSGKIRVADPESAIPRVLNLGSERLRGEYSLRASERRARITHTLTTAGADVLELSTAEDLDPPLRRFFAARISRRGYRRP